MTSMLAHRGWEVYLLPRTVDDTDTGASISEDQGWSEAVNAIVTARSRLGEDVIVLAADVGASLTLAALSQMKPPLAMAMFSPASPRHLGDAFARSLGFFAKRRFRRGSGEVAPTPALANAAFQPTDIATEPRRLINDLIAGVPFDAPSEHPPAIVFAPDGADPLVGADHAMDFATTQYARVAPSKLRGRWWPSLSWEDACAEAHRFLILTLSDRVVEFPDEIINDD